MRLPQTEETKEAIERISAEATRLMMALAEGDNELHVMSRELFNRHRGVLLDQLAAQPDVQESNLQRRDLATILEGAFRDHDKAVRRVSREAQIARRRAELLSAMAPVYARLTVAQVKRQAGMTADIDRVELEEVFRRTEKLLVEYDQVTAKATPGLMEEPEGILVEMLAALRHAREVAGPFLADLDRRKAESRRQRRMAAHRQPDVVMEGTRCSNCGKKPARVDDLCKTCAREAGTLPHGKIGDPS